MHRLKAVMLLLIANNAPLGPEWRDHALKGQWAPYRECHIGGDFLLIYRIDDADGLSGSVYFARAVRMHNCSSEGRWHGLAAFVRVVRECQLRFPLCELELTFRGFFRRQRNDSAA